MRWLLLLGLVGTGCVSYEKKPLDAPAMLEERAELAPGAVDFDAAMAFARAHNPELKRLRAQAEAAGFDVPPTHINITVNTLEQKAPGFVDPVALFKLGPRGARAQAAKEREAALLQELNERDLQIAAGIAEAFATERFLLSLQLPPIDADPKLFEKAGLASRVDRTRVEYARSKEDAERVAIESLRAENRARLCELLGVRPSAALTMLLPEGAFPPVPDRGDLFARPDLAVALARYRVADREFRAAVLDQYPVVGIGPVFNWDIVRWGLFIPTRIPGGADGPARAAGKRREAARFAVEAALLRAEREVAERRAAFVRFEAEAHAAQLGAKTAAIDLHSALVHLEVTPDAFDHLARAGPEAVERLSMSRHAGLAAVRARVRYAKAWAWPHTDGGVR
ncbi:MAG: hypothetical protein AAGD14_19250 [Planctomycetota bacterium]